MEIKQTKAARKIYGKLLFPYTKDFRWVIQSNHIKNCEVTVRDIDVAHEIWGKAISELKRKTTSSKPTHVAGDLICIYYSRYFLCEWSTILHHIELQD